jgi:DNA-binding NtrC family response regulator
VALRQILDGAASLLEFSAHPRLLGSEALHLLNQLGYRGSRSADDREGVRIEPPVTAEHPGGLLTIDRDSVAIPLDDEGLVLRVGCPVTFEDAEILATLRKLVALGRDLERFAELRRRRASFWDASPPDSSLTGGVFVSATTLEVLDTARKVAPTDIPVLLTGETGTGKELLARAIHECSTRAKRTFLPFDCNSVPRDLLDSQLFGHQRGAFTGAHEPFAGVIRAAEGGTLFLDEIGELSLAVQPKLLRFLETRQVHPLGATSPVAVNVRIIAATNADLDRLINDGLFREDLYYRLNVIRLKLPPLRERREEIPPLIQHFLAKHSAALERSPTRLSDETLEYLLLYRWPGNVRELSNEMSRLVALAEPGSTIGPDLLSPHIRAARRTMPADTVSPDTLQLSMTQTLAGATDQLERAMIAHALSASDGHLETAATILGLSRKGLYLKRQRLGLAH